MSKFEVSSLSTCITISDGPVGTGLSDPRGAEGADQLPLSQPRGVKLMPTILLLPPGFFDLPTAMRKTEATTHTYLHTSVSWVVKNMPRGNVCLLRIGIMTDT